MYSDMKPSRRKKQGMQELVATGWTTAAFRISTTDGWLEVNGIVRPPLMSAFKS
jgi:hypothetical protein